MKFGGLNRRPWTKSCDTRRTTGTERISGRRSNSIDGVGKRMTLLFVTSRSSSVSVSNIAVAYYHGLVHVRSDPKPWEDKEPIRRAEAWFVKIVCTIFVRSNSLDRFLGYFSKFLSPSLVFEVIKRLNSPKLGLGFFLFSRERLNITHSRLTYNMLLNTLCRDGLYDSIKMVYDCMKLDGHLPDSWLLGSLVSSYALADRFNVSKELLDDFKSSKFEISAVVYNDLFNVLVKQKKVDDAIALFREHMGSHFRPETCTFNILMRGLCRAGETDEAIKLLNDMRSCGCSPDIVTFNTLIHGFCRINEVNRAKNLLEQVYSKGQFAPDVVTYTTLISGYCKLTKMEEAANLYDEMIRCGVKPNQITFNALIDGFGKDGDMTSALAMHEKMLFHGCVPDVVTYTSLIDGYCRIGQVNHGLNLWHEMNAKNITPNLYTFSVLINALSKSNRLHEAREFLRLLKLRDIVPKPFMYNPVIDGYCKSGNVDEANVIVAEMEQKRCKPDKVTFTILIIGHCMKGRMLEAIDIFHKMLAVGCAPDDITVNSLRSCLLKAGMPGEAAHIKQALVEKQTPKSLKMSYHPVTNADMPILGFISSK
ncbi:pentatricopeptide repeat-containing protein At2g06000-like isoform X2 [Neltuma alba]|uniref:pentatricopeptide repeat-containing protein At2g06000-like isoform X2 n=1 Tax=Neltuma alba TaxID=207710 RepID=UPI0010A5650D|nr:pentatricopeptide repeat-containing protein At2g06000-like isoform X2 [Prosopis alba]